jgi:hypothetical protein
VGLKADFDEAPEVDSQEAARHRILT